MDSGHNAVVRKRLHVASLTQAVSASGLSQRLGTFGTVIAVDGVGALDGIQWMITPVCIRHHRSEEFPTDKMCVLPTQKPSRQTECIRYESVE